MAFAQFLFDRLNGGKLSDEVPAESLKMICVRTAGYYLMDGVFTADTLVDWMVSDYGFQRSEVNEIIAGLQPAAAALGVKLQVGDQADGEEYSIPLEKESEPAEGDCDRSAACLATVEFWQ